MGRPALKVNNGDIFGLYTVIDNTPIVKDGHTYVKVRCECGNEKLKTISDLKSRRGLGCSKCRGERFSIPISIGQVFGDWTVTEGPITDAHKNSISYKCKCICGTEHYVSKYDLLEKRSVRCSKCSTKHTAKKTTEANGCVGELTLSRFNKLKTSAKLRSLEFNVTIKYLWDLFVEQNKTCAITGDKLEFSKASLDRIDSSIGYVPGNVQWVSIQANLSKHTMSMSELIEFCNKVINHANQQPSQPLTKLEGSETNS